MYFSEEQTTHFHRRVLTNCGLRLSGHFGVKHSDKKNRKNSQVLSSIHVLFSVLKCLDIPKLYIAFKNNKNILKLNIFELYQVFMSQNVPILSYCLFMTHTKSIN